MPLRFRCSPESSRQSDGRLQPNGHRHLDWNVTVILRQHAEAEPRKFIGCK
jgi:hypothetical protein